MQMRAVPCLLFFALVSAAVADDDVSAFVQAKIRAHRSDRELLTGLSPVVSLVAGSFGRQMAEAAAKMAEKGALAPDPKDQGEGDHVFIKRKITMPAGGNVEFEIASENCQTHDEYGNNDCTLQWGEVLSVRSVAHLPQGLEPEDRVVLTMTARAQAFNSSDPRYNQSFGDVFSGGFDCSICGGTCTVSMANADKQFAMDTTFPTMASNKTYCEELAHSPATEIPLLDFTVALPEAPTSSWQIAADTIFTTEVRKADGTVKVSQSVEPKIMPGSVARKTLQEADPRKTPSLASLGEVLQTSLRRATPTMISQALKSNEEGKGIGKKLNAFIAKIHLSGVENGKFGGNFSLSAAKGCSRPDSYGSVTCKFPFGQELDMDLGVHLAYTTELGSFAVVKSAPKVGGMLGMMAGALLKPQTTKVPLCGEGMVKIDPKLPEKKVEAGPCGFHALNIVAPAVSFFLPDLTGLSLKDAGVPLPPMMPSALEELPPMSVEVEVKMKHGDGKPIGTFVIELGVGYKS